MGLMEALVATGDRTAALQHARVYEVLLQQALEAPPDREVVALAERIRQQSVEQANSEPAVRAAAAVPSLSAERPVERVAERAAAPLANPLPAPTKSLPSLLSPSCRPPPPPVKHPSIPPRPRRAARRAAVGVLLGLGVAAGATVLHNGASREISIGRTSRITAEPGMEVHPALSPDGKFVAYAAGPEPAGCESMSGSWPAVGPSPSRRASPATSTGRAGPPTEPGSASRWTERST